MDPSFYRLFGILFILVALLNNGLCAVLGSRALNAKATGLATNGTLNNGTGIHQPSSTGDFPVCTDLGGPFSPFCLPQDGASMTVDATYYVTWNADFYPLNATITIELRYLDDSLNGDSAFTSDRTDNSYGYIPLSMRKEWLQGKPSNNLTLYIIELDPKSDRRASVRQGPTITLSPKPVEHYKPPPSLPYNRLALFIGLPVSLVVVIIVVAGLFFGMQERRKIGLGNVMGSRDKGYGIGQSKIQRLSGSKNTRATSSDADPTPRKYTDDLDEGFPEMVDAELQNELERTAGHVFKRDTAGYKT